MIPALVVPILTRPDLLHAMIASVDYPVEHLIVVDNSGQVDAVDCLFAQRTSIITMPANLGVAGSWNLGIKAAPFAPWWLIANFDLKWPTGSLAAFDEVARTDQIVLSGATPPWCAFALGEDIVGRIGLFDERFHPAYFEDNDYEHRATRAGFTVTQSDIPVEHRNSSTIRDGYQSHNDVTFVRNRIWLERKRDADDLSDGWSLERRRKQSWD